MKNRLSKVMGLGVISLAAMLLTACNNQNNQSFNQSLKQTIASGTIKGRKDSKNNVLEWLGIPYARANRWQAPQKVKKSSKVFDATKTGEADIQYSNDEVVGSENALNLDVVRPDTDQKDLPVIVYLHGGNNQTGNAQEIKGNTLVNDLDAVYVSVNYRLGVFGFNPLKAIKTGTAEENSGNFALLDIASALDWVKENIDTFGGDTDNVTLAGFSAGGRDVMATLISPLFAGKYDKAISFSGGMTLADETDSQEIVATAIAPLVVEDGVKTTLEEARDWLLSADTTVADYLNKVPAERLAKLMGNAMIRMSVFPHLYTDGTVIPKEGFETKNYNEVPLMLLTGTNEFSLFTAFDSRFSTDFASGDLFTDKEKAAEFAYARNYGSQLYRLSNGVESARLMANKAYSSPIYIGEIAYGDNYKVTPDLAKTFGAFHGIFEPMLQTPSNYESFIGDDFKTNGAKAMAKDFKTYLKNFLASGNPNTDKLSQWPEWKKKDEVLSISATANHKQIKASQDQERPEDILEKMSNDQTLSTDIKDELNATVLNGRWFSSVIDNQK